MGLGCLLLCGTSSAQIDPEARQLFQFGYNQALEGRGPVAGYAYYYLNKPDFIRANTTLRLAVAPVYVDSELGFARVLGDRTDLSIGFAGGGFGDSYSEVRGGRFLKEESFTGHGGEISIGAYHIFNPGDDIPLHGVLRLAAHHSVYERDDRTLPNFVLPDDQTAFHFRAGLRFGGSAPVMIPDMAMEISGWYEGQIRTRAGRYGLAGDRQLEISSHLFWSRAMLTYTLPESKQTFQLSVIGGGAISADRFSAYRLGSVLPMAAEFPLTLPGYYFQEISSDRFVLMNFVYHVPLDQKAKWTLMAGASTAVVNYLAGFQQPGDWHTGLMGGIGYRTESRSCQVILGYAYGVDAIRSHGRGANTIGILCQFDLGAFKRTEAIIPGPEVPQRSRGLFRVFE